MLSEEFRKAHDELRMFVEKFSPLGTVVPVRGTSSHLQIILRRPPCDEIRKLHGKYFRGVKVIVHGMEEREQQPAESAVQSQP